MSKVVDITDASKNFKNVGELKKYAFDLEKKLFTCTEVLQKQKEEIDHLKALLSKSVPILSNNLELGDISNSQLLCEMEIARFKALSEQRPLTLEEAKKFDIFNKNLLSIKRPKDDDDAKVEYDESTLITIAKKPNE